MPRQKKTTLLSARPKRKLKIRPILLPVLTILVIVLVVNALIAFLITNGEKSKIYTAAEDVPAAPVAIVFGAGVTKDDQPRAMLNDRLESGIELYKMGKVQKLLLTGGDQEVRTMQQYAIGQNVPLEAIIADNAGLNTYDSCYRASHSFNVTDAIVVTQGFHLSRTLYLCNSLGVNSVGFKAGSDNYPWQQLTDIREFFAQSKAWLDVTLLKPKA